MTLDIKRSPGRPKNLPDFTPIIKEAITEWNKEHEEQQEKNKITWAYVLDDILCYWIKCEIAVLILAVILYISSKTGHL